MRLRKSAGRGLLTSCVIRRELSNRKNISYFTSLRLQSPSGTRFPPDWAEKSSGVPRPNPAHWGTIGGSGGRKRARGPVLLARQRLVPTQIRPPTRRRATFPSAAMLLPAPPLSHRLQTHRQKGHLRRQKGHPSPHQPPSPCWSSFRGDSASRAASRTPRPRGVWRFACSAMDSDDEEMFAALIEEEAEATSDDEEHLIIPSYLAGLFAQNAKPGVVARRQGAARARRGSGWRATACCTPTTSSMIRCTAIWYFDIVSG